MTGIILLVLRIAASVALYALLGSIFLLMWRNLKQEALFLAQRKTEPLALELATPGSEPQVFHFSQGDVVLGRDPDCQCVVADGTISARHVRFAFHHGQWWAEDLGSRNGTRLNETALTTPTIIVHGDTLACGQAAIKIILEQEPAPDPEQAAELETIP